MYTAPKSLLAVAAVATTWVGSAQAQAQSGAVSAPVSAQRYVVGEADTDRTPQYAEFQVPQDLGVELIRLADRMAALERLVARILARQDEDGHAVTSALEELRRFRGDTELRLGELELGAQRLTQIEAASAIQASEMPEDVQEPDDQPEDRFEQGKDLARQEDWQGAELVFSTFIATNPDDPRIPEARYELGLAYMGQQQPAQAAQIFLDLFQSGDAAAFGAANLFALARALSSLDPANTEQICSVYGEIQASFGEALTVEQREMLLDAQLATDCSG